MNPGNIDDCGLMAVDETKFWWRDASCLTTDFESKKVAPICQHERLPRFEEHCYFFSPTKLNWENAEADCVTRGGHLASVHSKAEKDFILSMYDPSKYDTALGGSDIATEVYIFSLFPLKKISR